MNTNLMLTRPVARKVGHAKGFTLIELLIAVVVIGILGAIAVPIYTQHVQRTYRGDSLAVMREAALYMQRFYSANNRYDRSVAGNPPELPANLQHAPAGAANDGEIRYDITIEDLTATTFTLRATPTGSMAGDECGTLTLTQDGIQGIEESEKEVADCWK